MRDHGPRGGQWLSRGEDSVHRRLDLKLDPNRKIHDWSSRAGAEELVAIITAFWERKGAFHVRCEILVIKQLAGTSPQKSIWCVKSNLVYGRPPGSKVYD